MNTFIKSTNYGKNLCSGYLLNQIFEIIIWFQIIRFGRFCDAINNSTGFGSFNSLFDVPVVFTNAERAVKSYVMERKNFLFHNTVKGTKASAVVYTLAETAKANGLNIRLYLETVMTKMLDYKNEPDSILEELMPWSEAMQKSCSLNNGTI